MNMVNEELQCIRSTIEHLKILYDDAEDKQMILNLINQYETELNERLHESEYYL